jgi:hypothetical protein
MWGYFQPLSRGSATGGEQPNVGRTFNLDDIVVDPELGRQIEEYDINVQDQVRRAYILKGLCQPKGLNFPHRQYG